VSETEQLATSLDCLEQSLSEVRSMARTLAHSVNDLNEWDDQFRRRWTDLLREVGRALQRPSSDGLAQVRTELPVLASDYSDQHLSSLHWPEYGALILSLRNVASAMDRAAVTDPAATDRADTAPCRDPSVMLS
jgi:hypothetical protein